MPTISCSVRATRGCGTCCAAGSATISPRPPRHRQERRRRAISRSRRPEDDVSSATPEPFAANGRGELPMQRNGRVNSGDVSIFYRTFGARGQTPILLMHGANYFDSYDWIKVAEALATDREVASFDKRGVGESGWSPSKDYSVDANMGDIHAVIAELRW